MSAYLLDTHALLWALQDDPQLNQAARDAIEDEGNDVFFSVASIWEIAIKWSTGKMPVHPDEILSKALQSGFSQMDISADHAVAVADLPYVGNHRDPFDRILISQSQVNELILIT